MTKRYYALNDQNICTEHPEYQGIRTPQDLYDALSHVWCEYTCAPRMRKDWSEENMTLGQCSVTSFLAQDIFGGDVFGIPLKEGGFHCFNRVDTGVFDLTSEQFQNEKLDYENVTVQKREDHFQKKEKYERYLYLRDALKKYLDKKNAED
jgi:hypothetical protein